MSDYGYKIFIDTSDIYGHAFIGIYGPNGESEVWGYYPEKEGEAIALPELSSGYIVLDNGVLRRDDQWEECEECVDGMHPFDWSTEKVAITKEQYDAMKDFINTVDQAQGDKWIALGNNCVQFVGQTG